MRLTPPGIGSKAQPLRNQAYIQIHLANCLWSLKQPQLLTEVFKRLESQKDTGPALCGLSGQERHLTNHHIRYGKC